MDDWPYESRNCVIAWSAGTEYAYLQRWARRAQRSVDTGSGVDLPLYIGGRLRPVAMKLTSARRAAATCRLWVEKTGARLHGVHAMIDDRSTSSQTKQPTDSTLKQALTQMSTSYVALSTFPAVSSLCGRRVRTEYRPTVLNLHRQNRRKLKRSVPSQKGSMVLPYSLNKIVIFYTSIGLLHPGNLGFTSVYNLSILSLRCKPRPILYCLLLNTVSQKRPPLYNLNSTAKMNRFSMIFGVQNREEISQQKIINSLTSPE